MRISPWLLVLALSAVAPPAFADAAAAQKLFEEAKALRDEGNWSEACRKFAASMKLDASVGTLLNLAKCHEHEGKLATALAAYEEARVMNRGTADPARKKAIGGHIDGEVSALEPRVPTLAIRVTPPVSGLSVRRGDTAVPVEALGEPLPVDPGEIVVVAEATGMAGEARVTVAEGERATLVVELLPVEAAPTPTETPDPAPPADAADEDGVPVWAWVSGGVGVAFLGASIGMAVWYRSTVSTLEESCGGELVPCLPDPPGSYDPADDNRTKNLAMGLGIGFGVAAGAGIVAAIVGITTAGSEDGAVGLTPNGVVLRF